MELENEEGGLWICWSVTNPLVPAMAGGSGASFDLLTVL